MRWFLQFLTGSHTQPCKSRRPCAGKIMRSCQHDVQECFAASRSSKYKPPRRPAKTASTATTASSSSSCARTANHCHHHCHHHHHQNHYNDNGSNRNSWVVRDGSESYEPVVKKAFGKGWMARALSSPGARASVLTLPRFFYHEHLSHGSASTPKSSALPLA